MIVNRPVFGMSCGPTIALPPSPFAFSVLASQLATWKYGIQYDGMCAGMCSGFVIMPMLGVPSTLNSVYSIGVPAPPCFGVQPNSFV